MSHLPKAKAPNRAVAFSETRQRRRLQRLLQPFEEARSGVLHRWQERAGVEVQHRRITQPCGRAGNRLNPNVIGLVGSVRDPRLMPTERNRVNAMGRRIPRLTRHMLRRRCSDGRVSSAGGSICRSTDTVLRNVLSRTQRFYPGFVRLSTPARGPCKIAEGHCFLKWLTLAGEPGFEPRQTESESVVLPLHHSPTEFSSNCKNLLKCPATVARRFCTR